MVKKVVHILDTTRPYQMFFFIFGIAPFPLHIRNPLRHSIVSVLVFVYKTVLVSAALFTTYERCKFISMRDSTTNDYLTNSLHFAQFVTLTMIPSLLHIIVFFKHNALKRILFEIQEIERDSLKISSKMHELCLRVVFKRQLFCVSGFMILTVIFTPLTTIHTYFMQTVPILHWILGVLSEIAIRCKSIEFCVLVQVFNELLSELLVCISDLQKTNMSVANDRRLFDERFMLQKRIVAIQNIQSKTWKAVNEFTDYFSTAVLCQFVWNGLTITNIMYWSYVKFNEASLIINLSRISTLAFFLLDILLPCYLCDLCIQTYGKIARVIHDFKPRDKDTLLKVCLKEYSLQMTHQKLIFSCGGYFNINLKCFGEIVRAITTYIVILIQFKLQGDKQ